MQLQVLLDEFGERYCPAVAGTDPIERLPQRLLSLRATREPTDLRTQRGTTLEAMPVCPQRLPVDAFRL
ncbi:MAG TPA: hypothetical protein VGL78_00685 [Solirubrobacteraceae bacterium]|jgi:hypothetical protein